ncbi:RNA-binding protein [Legionella bononiensis]|uniref:RNA-binding protein n=1 Tax=Legionella bononiensis TaxID=2793102 RepID=A0ABS1WG95_9GAMM|nr:RNA-binding protein [Legionella bononiensis]MBL7481836.1 RNA-binding protein [Legionella bononiensis]MBL7528385.1 RNA-binding protein [Legionella bononiensis]MBL7564348.1 RNA-binding protein [Legionella bononiensis]
MKILYVPFSREKAGDLTNLVNIWKENHLKNYNSPIKIVYFNEHAGIAPEDVTFEVFICAHGCDEINFMFVGNHVDFSKADFIDIQTVAERFNHDFLYYSTQIISTHLYCCGNYQKNKSIAEQFQANVLGTVGIINYYNGSITTVDEQGKQWSLGGSKPVPVAETARKIFVPYISLEHEMNKRKSIKHRPTYEECLEQRRNKFFANCKKNRFKAIQERRHGSNESVSISLR